MKKNCKIICILLCVAFVQFPICQALQTENHVQETKKDYIKWVDFKVPYNALDAALKIDIENHDTETPMSWIELLAFLTAKNGNNFSRFKVSELQKVVDKVKAGETITAMSEGLKFYSYYFEVYQSVLGEFVGPYRIALPDQDDPEKLIWREKYGLRAFCPIADGYEYGHCDDFGTSRSFGYKRRHLGHDMMGLVGTPICAVEGGRVEALGWNKYGGWRIGVRSFDNKRYYYYAHLRQDRPYHESIKIGAEVKAGDVIGYLGRTGYSTKENVNNLQTNHLHWGIQLIFDESQKDGSKEIWIDPYAITRLLNRNRTTVCRDEETKEYDRKYPFELTQSDNAR